MRQRTLMSAMKDRPASASGSASSAAASSAAASSDPSGRSRIAGGPNREVRGRTLFGGDGDDLDAALGASAASADGAQHFAGCHGANGASSSSLASSTNSAASASLRQTRLSFGPTGSLGLDTLAEENEEHPFHGPRPPFDRHHHHHHHHPPHFSEAMAEEAARLETEREGEGKGEVEVAPSSFLLGAHAACTTNVGAMQHFFAALHPTASCAGADAASSNHHHHHHHHHHQDGPRMSQEDIPSTDDDETSNDSMDTTTLRNARQIGGTRKRRSDGDQGGRGSALMMDGDGDGDDGEEASSSTRRLGGDGDCETTDDECDDTTFHQRMRLGGGTSKNLASLFGNAAAAAGASGAGAAAAAGAGAKVDEDEEEKEKEAGTDDQDQGTSIYPTQQETKTRATTSTAAAAAKPSFFASVTAAANNNGGNPNAPGIGSAGGTSASSSTMDCSSPPRTGTTASVATTTLAFGSLAAASGATSGAGMAPMAPSSPPRPKPTSANSFLSSNTTAGTTANPTSSSTSSGITTSAYGVNANGTAPKDGRYSFTASPIDETEEDIFRGVGNKVRRLNLGPDDASTTSAATSSKRSIFKKMKAEPSFSNGGFALGLGGMGRGGGSGSLSVHTSFGSGGGSNKLMDAIEEEMDDGGDRISPTDVMSFPAMTLDMSTAAAGPPPKTPRSGRRNPVGMSNMMTTMDDGDDEASWDGTDPDDYEEDATPAAPKISRSARASGGNKYNNARPGTPTLEDRIATSTEMASPGRMGGFGAASSPPRSMTATSHTPHRSLGRPPATPVMEKRLVRRTPKVFTFQDEDTAGRVGGPTPLAPPLPPKTPGSSLGVKRRSRFGDRDEDMEQNNAQSASAGRFETDFQIVGRPLGNGSFGTVYKCLSKVDGCTYAIKVANRRIKGVADRERMLKEVYALAALCDQADTAAFHIVRYHQAWMEEGRLHIQTELCTSTLQAELENSSPASAAQEMMELETPAPAERKPMSHERRYKLLREILLALELIHRNNMCHLDIKPENIFIKTDQYKLGDFGLVSKISTSGEVEEGDSRYMSMELLSFGEHEDLTKSDIFSLGATMYEVCLGRSLPENGDEWQDIRHGKLQMLPDTPLPLQSIISEMMHPDPKRRPDASSLLKRRELLSAEQKQLLLEQNKVREANLALAVQQERMKQLPARPGGGGRKLVRHNTWNGGASGLW